MAIGKATLVKKRGRSIYLISKNTQIRLWHRRLGHASNTRVIEISKITDSIEIMIDKSQYKNKDKCLSSDYKSEADKDINSTSSENNNKPEPSTATQLNQVTDLNEIEELYDSCIKSKHTKINRYKRITSTNRRLQEIHTDLWRPHNLRSLSGKIYISLLLNEFTKKSWILLLRSKNEFFDAFKL